MHTNRAAVHALLPDRGITPPGRGVRTGGAEMADKKADSKGTGKGAAPAKGAKGAAPVKSTGGKK